MPMISLTSILVDVDAVAANHPALDQAVMLAARSGARVKIVDVLPWVPSSARHFVTADLEHELVEHRRERLKTIAVGLQQVAVETELLRGRPGAALIQEVVRSGHGLLVRSHVRDLAADPRPFGAIDMELLRHCPCPVWLVGAGAPQRPWRILAAIHANPADATEQALNAVILDWGLTLKGCGDDAQLTILQAWTAFGGSVLRSRMSSEEFAAFVEAARRTEREALSEFLTPFSGRLTDVAVELAHGEPEDAIARFVESHGVDVVVMGTVARTGIAGLIMGNTAERVLQRLRGSVLAVKPPGFEAPVART
jgi:nucleotide-binding universal stress UspA family protein